VSEILALLRVTGLSNRASRRSKLEPKLEYYKSMLISSRYPTGQNPSSASDRPKRAPLKTASAVHFRLLKLAAPQKTAPGAFRWPNEAPVKSAGTVLPISFGSVPILSSSSAGCRNRAFWKEAVAAHSTPRKLTAPENKAPSQTIALNEASVKSTGGF